MADKKITDFEAAAAVDDTDLFLIGDPATGKLRSITAALAGSGFVTAGSASDAEAVLGAVASKALTPSNLRAVQPTVDIRWYGAVGDGVTDCTSAFQAAIDQLSDRAFPGGTLIIPENVTMLLTSAVSLRDAPITVRGEGSTSIITATSTIASAAFVNDPTLNLPGFSISGVRFVGGAVDIGQGNGPTRARTTTSSFSSAIKFEGWRTGETGRTNVFDVNITDCEFVNIAGLPIFLDGVRELARAHGNLFRNTLDPGFIGCDEVIFNDNVTERGADNGVSVSRGCKRITITGNLSIECAYNGIWVSGFDTEAGPDYLVVSGNTVERCGTHGIRVVDGVHTGTISGNTVRSVYRGTTDIPDDNAGCGIRLGDDDAALTVSGINVVGNTFEECKRGGVLIGERVSDCVIAHNLIINPGSATYNDGSSIAAIYESSNFGVLVEAPATRVEIRDNTFVDNRVTQVANHPISVLSNTSGAACGNTAYGFRQSLVETAPGGGIALGATGRISAPAHPRIDIAGDISGVFDIAMPDWTPASDATIAARYLTTGNKRHWRLTLNTAGTLTLTWSTDGSNFTDTVTNANLSALAANARRWLWFEFDVDNGASGRAFKVFTSTDAVTWTQTGTTVTTATATSIYTNGLTGANLELGAYGSSTNGAAPTAPLGGTIYSASIRSGITGTSTPGGTEVAAWELDSIASRRKDRYGNLWTLRGTTTSYANPVSTSI